MIKKVHHIAYRCRDSEETRRFYEDFLGLPLVASMLLRKTKTGQSVDALHTFYALEDDSCLAFFEVPELAFEFKQQNDFDLHLALEVDQHALHLMHTAGSAAGIETRGVIDHGMIHSVYFRDPNGYVIELSAKSDGYHEAITNASKDARTILDSWQSAQKASIQGTSPGS